MSSALAPWNTHLKEELHALGERWGRLPQEPAFVRFLLETGRTHMRRKEDIQTRREGDASPAVKFVAKGANRTAQNVRKVVDEFDAWVRDNNVRLERRKE